MRLEVGTQVLIVGGAYKGRTGEIQVITRSAKPYRCTLDGGLQCWYHEDELRAMDDSWDDIPEPPPQQAFAGGPGPKMVDHYEELEVEKGADAATVKKSYRKLVLKYHPDKNPDDKAAAEARIRRVNEAYECLSNPAKRRAYDAQVGAISAKAQGMRVNTKLVQPRMSIPKEFMICPIGHPEKFLRGTDRDLKFLCRTDVPDVEFDNFFQASRFSLWWLPEVANMCRLRTRPFIGTGIVSKETLSSFTATSPSGQLLSFGVSPEDPVSAVMLTDTEHPQCTNVIVQASPEYPGAFRFHAAMCPTHYLAYDPPMHASMMAERDQFAVIDFMLMDYGVSEAFRTLEEVLIPSVLAVGGDRDFVKLTKICQDQRVMNWFRVTMGGALYDFNDFAAYFDAHSDRWEYDQAHQRLRLRTPQAKLERSVLAATKAMEAVKTVSGTDDTLLRNLSFEAWAKLLHLLYDGAPANSESHDAQLRCFSLLRDPAIGGKAPTLAGLGRVCEKLLELKSRGLEKELEKLRAAGLANLAASAPHLFAAADTSLNFETLARLVDIPLDWEACSMGLTQKAPPVLGKEPLDKLVPLIRRSAKAGASKLGECIATAAMMKTFGAPPEQAADALDAMVDGGFGMEAAPMMIGMLWPKVPREASTKILVGLAENGHPRSAPIDALWAEILVDDELAALSPQLLARLAGVIAWRAECLPEAAATSLKTLLRKKLPDVLWDSSLSADHMAGLLRFLTSHGQKEQQSMTAELLLKRVGKLTAKGRDHVKAALRTGSSFTGDDKLQEILQESEDESDEPNRGRSRSRSRRRKSQGT